MEEKMEIPTEKTKALPPVTPQPEKPETPVQKEVLTKGQIAMIVIAIVVLVAAIIGALVFLYTQGEDVTARVRDIFIIFMAFESLIIGVALIILIVQLALLTNLLQNEIKPIIDSTNETVNTVRGTATFLSDNLAEPVIKLNEYLAYLKKVSDLLNPGKRK
ncbi:MAG: hypothetical protein RBT34_05220 [Anaerolineaceae bacterium]|jgi:hypothetical protein|nr:hypothetical protein [Anaerolineaceae bacterium]